MTSSGDKDEDEDFVQITPNEDVDDYLVIEMSNNKISCGMICILTIYKRNFFIIIVLRCRLWVFHFMKIDCAISRSFPLNNFFSIKHYKKTGMATSL